MRGKIGAMVAAMVAAASATGAAVWAKRRKDESDSRAESRAEPKAESPGASTSEAPADEADDLTSLKGIGAVSQERLWGVGVTTFGQIAGWDDEELESVAAQIKVSPERIRREDWVGQARAVIES